MTRGCRSPTSSRSISTSITQCSRIETPRACFGELGLTGELRWVGHPERRADEAARHGLEALIAPPDSDPRARAAANLREALALALPGQRGARIAASRGAVAGPAEAPAEPVLGAL